MSLENIKLMHIVGETVVLSAVVYYFINQNKAIRAELQEVKQKLSDEIAAQNKHFNNIYSLLDGTRKTLVQFQQQASLSNNSHQVHSPGQPTGIRKRKVPIVQFKEEDESEKDNPAPIRDLDDEISSELQELEDDTLTEEPENTEEEQTRKIPFKAQQTKHSPITANKKN